MSHNQPKPGGAVGVLIPQFPTQTHVAMWRVAQAMRRLGVTTYLLSTRRVDDGEDCHDELLEEAEQTFYAWPPRWGAVVAWLLSHPRGVAASLRYLLTLKEESWSRRVKLVALIASAANLASFCQRNGLRHVFVHSCADAAHMVAMMHRLGGPPYALRLGGDLEVYGVDHAAKMRDATLIAAAAENNRREVIDKIGLPESDVITLPLGVDTRRFMPDAEHATEQDALGKLKLLSVSRLHPRKGLDDVLHAIAIAKERGIHIDYEMIGDGPSRKELETLVKQLGLQDQVTMPGAKGQDEIIEAAGRAEAFVLASFSTGEGSPVAMIEAMACGLAVVSTRVGGTADMMSDGVEGLLVEQRSVEQLADALVRLANEPETRRAMGAAARRTAQERYDVLSVGRLLLERFGIQARPDDQGDDAGVPAPASAQAEGAARASA